MQTSKKMRNITTFGSVGTAQQAFDAQDLQQLRGKYFASTLKNKKITSRGSVILRGRVSNDDCQRGLSVHTTDVLEVRNYSAQATVSPALTLNLILLGRIEGALDNQKFVLDASDGPKGYVWSLNRPTAWSRKIFKNQRVRKVTISVSHEWLRERLKEESKQNKRCFEDFLTGPIDIQQWAPSSKTISLAEQIINPQSQPDYLLNIYRESRALEILAEVLTHMAKAKEKTNEQKAPKKEIVDASQIRDYLDENIEQQLSMEIVAANLAMSPNTLQRKFKSAFNTTVIDYLRTQRLVQARDAIERDGMTIAQAAHMAGYSNRANFSTAFKREFGFPPSRLA
jgi:AraC-like DNA-binding protein